MSTRVHQGIALLKKMPQGWLDAFQHYFYYKGRTNRLGFWSFLLINSFILLVLFIIDDFLHLGYRIFVYGMYRDVYILSTIYFLITLIPSICLCIRRLHDLNLRGWWVLCCFIPFSYLHLGFFCRLLFLIAASYPGHEDNRFGKKPEARFTT